MLITHNPENPPALPEDWRARWEGPDGGLIASWRRGLEKRTESPDIAAKALAGELPVLAWRGGVLKPIKGRKIGALLYLAAWQGLRGESLNIDTDQDVTLTCSRTGQDVIFTMDLNHILAAAGTEGDEQ